MLDRLKRVPWIVWAALLAFAIIAVVRLVSHGRRPVVVIGTGPLVSITEADAPEDERYAIDVRAGETPRAVSARVRESLGGYPDIVVVGLPEAATRADTEAIARACANAPAEVVFVGTNLESRADCRRTGCVDARAGDLGERLRTAVREARRRYAQSRIPGPIG